MSRKLHHCFGLQLLSLLIMASYFMSTSQANINQRIIIYFNQPLTLQTTAEVHEQLKSYLQGGYSLAEHSSNERWILVLNSSLNQQQLNQFKKEFLKSNRVKHIELDQLLRPGVTPLTTVDIF